MHGSSSCVPVKSGIFFTASSNPSEKCKFRNILTTYSGHTDPHIPALLPPWVFLLNILHCRIFVSVHIRSLREQCPVLIGKITFLLKLEWFSAMDVYSEITGKDAALCPCCKKGSMEIVHQIPIPDS